MEEADIGFVSDIPVEVSAILGSCFMPISQPLKFGRGVVFKLNKKSDDPLDILVNNRLFASGELTITDNVLAVKIIEIIRVEKD